MAATFNDNGNRMVYTKIKLAFFTFSYEELPASSFN